jgi:hypothetical protein
MSIPTKFCDARCGSIVTQAVGGGGLVASGVIIAIFVIFCKYDT